MAYPVVDGIACLMPSEGRVLTESEKIAAPPAALPTGDGAAPLVQPWSQ